ncbi:hypothetical protein D3C81_1983990 [compost metagenome]
MADLLAPAIKTERPAPHFAEQPGELVAQTRLNPGQQFIKAERLNHIVVSPDRQTFNAVIHFILGCKHDDSKFRFFRA